MRDTLLTDKEKARLKMIFNEALETSTDHSVSYAKVVIKANIPKSACTAALRYVARLRRKALNDRVKSIIDEKGQAIIDDYRSGLTIGEVARKNSITSEETALLLLKGYKTKKFHYFVETAEELK